MRLTFPTLSLATPSQVCYQATLACLPLAVNLLANCFFNQRSKITHAGWAALPTLIYNPWALGGGCALLVIYEIYLAYQAPTAAPKPAESELIYDNPSFKITLLTIIIESVINEEIYNAKELSKGQSLDEFETLPDGYAKALLAGLLVKRELRSLETPLLESIREDLVQTSQRAKDLSDSLTDVDPFVVAVKKLRADQQEIFRILFPHLKRISLKSAVNKMTSQRLAAIFAPLLFQNPEATQPALVYLIEHALLPSTASPTEPLPRSQPKSLSCWETPNITRVASFLIDMITKKKVAAIYETAGPEPIVRSYLKKLDMLLSNGRSPQNFTLDSVLEEISRIRSVHIAASIFKRLFQRLETPLLQPIQADIRNAYMAKPELKLESFKTAIKRLDSESHHLLRITLEHLSTIAKNCSSTQMNSSKLAQTFVPLFFEIKAANEHPYALGHAIACLITPLVYMIDNADNLFE